MATHYSTEMTGVLDGTSPVQRADGRVVNADVKTIRATVPLTAQASGDTIVLGKLPTGGRLLFAAMNASATLGGTATVALGSPSAPAKYRAAATFTTANTPVLVNLSAAADDAPLGEEETVILTVGAAALPGSGTLVIDLVYSAIN